MSTQAFIRTTVLVGTFLLLIASVVIPKPHASSDSEVDLSVSKSGPATAAPNSAVTYQILVSNSGPDTADATMIDTLPSNLTFTSITTPAGWTCTTPPVGSTGTIKCVIPSLSVIQNVPFTIAGNVDPSAMLGSFITNKAAVSTSAGDTNDENDESAATLRVGNDSSTNLGVMLSANTETASAGAEISYTITLTNSAPAINVNMQDKIPTGMTFVSISAPPGWTCSHPAVGAAGIINCAISTLDATSGVSFTAILKIPSTALDGDVFTNFASVTSDTYDVNDEDNAAAVGVTVVGIYSISITSGNKQAASINSPFATPLQVTVTVNNSPKSGANVTFQAPSDGPSLTFSNSDANVEIVTTDANGVAISSTATANTIAGGPYAVVVTAGNASAMMSLTNNKGNQTISFPPIATHTYGEAPFSLTAATSSNLPIAFTVISGPAAVSGNSVTLLGAGNVTLEADQQGDANHNAAQPSQQSFSVLKQTPAITVASTVNPADLGETIKFTATVSGTTNSPVAPSGNVQFKDGSVPLNSPATCVAAGNTCVAQISSSNLSAGSHVITAVYNGDPNYGTASGALANGQVINPMPSLSINEVSKLEGNIGTTPFDFTVALSSPSHLTVQVSYTTADGTAAIANRDYQTANRSVTFNPGEQTKILSVTVNGDLNRESDETFFVDLGSPSNASISKFRGTATIINDDTVDPPALLLEELQSRPNQAAALDTLLFLRDPFPVQSTAVWLNLGPDKNTRIIVFASNLTLAKDEPPAAVSISLVDGNGTGFDVPADDVRALPNVPAITQITFRLPDNLASGPCGLTIKYHGLFSNQGIIRIK